jgi:hypothetical protein
MEIFKDIIGYEGYYQVSNLGNVKSLKRTALIGGFGKRTVRERILKILNGGVGYQRVHLCKDKNINKFFSHRLVAIAFIPNPENKKTVNHIDGNPANNCVSNLEWATQSENNYHAFRTGLKKTSPEHKERLRLAKCRKVINTETGAIYLSIIEASESIGINPITLGAQLRGANKNKTKLKYLETETIKY